MDFSHLRTLEVKDKITSYSLYQIDADPTPVLRLKPANQSNKLYFNQMIKRSRRNVKAMQAGRINETIINDVRDRDRQLFPKYVIVGWSDILDSEGQEVPFSVEACIDFLEALPDWVFDDIRNFAGDNANFLEHEQADDSGN